MSVSDEPMSFELVSKLVNNGELDKLSRSPEVMDKYNAHKQYLRDKGIDMVTYILSHELHWVPEDTPLDTPSRELLDTVVKPEGKCPFANTNDMTIIQNSYPYHLESGIEHLCVWVKFPLPPDPNSAIGDISPKDKSLIEKYINETFCNWLNIPRDHIVWFKNWTKLQSVKSVPHIHVIIKDMDRQALDRVLNTGGKAINYGSSDCKL
ncbi:hypothetical protein KL925_003527 [Ogataea polymorpha]|uniref:uncharacterized protein n=1 Tax=Ogataea polymorpha TaxID=460523 RepID=UPI0007F4D25D|nr:uncharacterized protein OGAPODRAFT_75674 [Ogataea polymorpha]KAG7888344.1 hypothetical protein KL936_003556 [Ogataea polymorpha]KAG7900324.1 hypothetical protein KL935_003067 [Ogataea polymorpha]KAG7926477.1 hypothetical protein KL925_003527 [Ogataea polymorpha]KAG7935573.1 hypothetical protein KL934_002132 [Ogataea polymorpha]OBA17830.1 hypothetical protein OGAPODRAFT_75674 [Ogataea polymorpha]